MRFFEIWNGTNEDKPRNRRLCNKNQIFIITF